MTRLVIPTAFALAAASVASAQDFNTSEPFSLALSSDVEDVDGSLLYACHAGAAIEALCLEASNATIDSSNTFTHNTTDAIVGEDYAVGPLVWVLQTSSINVSSGLTFQGTPFDSNVLPPLFFPGPSNDYVGFDDDDKLFIYSSYFDESTFEPGVYPTQRTPVPLYQVS